MQTKAHRQGIRSYRAQPDRHRHRGLCLLACCPGTVTNRPTIVSLKPALCVVPWRLGAQWKSPFQQFVFALETCSLSPLLSVFFRAAGGPDNPIEESPALARKRHPAELGVGRGKRKLPALRNQLSLPCPLQQAAHLLQQAAHLLGPWPLEKDQSLDTCRKYV